MRPETWPGTCNQGGRHARMSVTWTVRILLSKLWVRRVLLPDEHPDLLRGRPLARAPLRAALSSVPT